MATASFSRKFEKQKYFLFYKFTCLQEELLCVMLSSVPVL